VTETSQWQGPRFVLLLYVLLVAVAGVFGYVIGLARPKNLDPKLYMLIDLPPNAFGMAVYGSLTIATILGVMLLGVRYVAREYDTVENRG
jgi:hypothetical protein